MKKIVILVLAACLLCVLLISLFRHHSEKKGIAEHFDSMPSLPCGSGDSLLCIQDCPQVMPAELFKGVDDVLLNQLLPDGEAEASINVFLLHHGDRYILFDAGMGEANGGRLSHILDSLGNPNISDICLTHLHFDHIGGLFTQEGKAAFPNAVIHLSYPEYEAWTSGALSADNGMVKKMMEVYAGRVTTFEPGDVLFDGITTIPAPGHTPGHTIYDLDGVLVVGDILHAVALQVEHPEFCARFDFDPAQAVATRRVLLQRAEQNHETLAGAHFPNHGVLVK